MKEALAHSTETYKWVHDIRTHLHVMLSALLMMDNGKPDRERLQAYKQILRNNLSAAIHMTDALLNPEQVYQEQQERMLSISSVMEEICASFGAYAEHYGIELICDIESGLSAACEREALQRSLYNLVSNAIRYTPVGGVVHILAAKKEDHIVICISDTGDGIPEKNAAESANGLGLMIVRALVKQIGGEIMLKSEIGVGSTFAISLPA